MEPIIKIENLQKRFGELTAVDGLSFEIFPNEIFGLLGPNGAGKTTTISMICGLIPLSDGQITFNHKTKDQKSLLGYCSQENILYPKLTCFEQLIFTGQLYGLPPKLIKTTATTLLYQMGLSDKANTLASKLSGGMKRRLNICLALIHSPEILILDEPEAGLDPQSRILVRDFIKTFSREKTVILTTHNMDEADRLADRIAIIDHGKLLLLDTPQNLKKTIDEGDILELHIENSSQHAINLFMKELEDTSIQVRINTDGLALKHPNIIEYLPLLKKKAEISKLSIFEYKIREKSLEDVFIHITGRKLRE